MRVDRLACDGELRAWERPPGMGVPEFMAATAEELGEPAAVGHNMFVNGWFADLFNLMGGLATPSLVVGVVALGTGNMTGLPTRTDTAMAVEWHRYAPSGVGVNTTDPTNTTFSIFVPASDGAATLTEAGLWHGGATTASGSGRMSSHAVFNYAKAASTDIRIDYSVTRAST